MSKKHQDAPGQREARMAWFKDEGSATKKAFDAFDAGFRAGAESVSAERFGAFDRLIESRAGTAPKEVPVFVDPRVDAVWQQIGDVIPPSARGNVLAALEDAFATKPAPTRDEFWALPQASYPEIDGYMQRAEAFCAASSRGHREVASMTSSAVAEYMAFLDGKRLSKPLTVTK